MVEKERRGERKIDIGEREKVKGEDRRSEGERCREHINNLGI